MFSRNVLSLPSSRSLVVVIAWLALVVANGCKQGTDESAQAVAPTAELPLRILVVDDEPLAAAVKLAWDSRVDATTKILSLTTAELIDEKRTRLNADVILYPSYLIGVLAERELIEPFDSGDTADPTFDRQGLFELTRLREITWGTSVYAVPLGSPQLTLLYRKDIFTSLGIEPPTTWQEYATLASQLSDVAVVGEFGPVNEKAWCGTVEPLAADWAGTTLLARAAAYARHRNQYSTLFDFNSMEPLIASPPFERALDELVQIGKLHPGARLSPEETQRKFLAGECAMAITWANRSAGAATFGEGSRNDGVGVAELPGSRDVYNYRTQTWEQRTGDESPHASLIAIDGRLGSVTKECRRKKQALGMLFMISGEELGVPISTASSHTTLYRESQLGQASAWVGQVMDGAAAKQYGEVIQSALNRPAWLDAIRIRGRDEYIATLNRAVGSVYDDSTTSREALATAVAEWEQITDSIGREAQQRAYMRSLGLEP